MPYQYLCSASQFVTMSPPKYLSCERRLFLIRYFFFLRHFHWADSTRNDRKERKRRNGMSWRLLSEPDVAFQGMWHRSYPGERPRCPIEKIFAVILKINALLKWVLQVTLNALTFHWETKRQSDSEQRKLWPRRRKSDKRVDGNSSLSLSSQPWKSRCAANINKPSVRWRMTQGVVFPPVGNGCFAEAGDGFKSLTRQLLCFQWPQWNCSRWKWGQSTDIWMTVCLVVRHNHQLSDPVNG